MHAIQCTGGGGAAEGVQTLRVGRGCKWCCAIRGCRYSAQGRGCQWGTKAGPEELLGLA